MKAILNMIWEKTVQLFKRFWQAVLLCLLAIAVIYCIDFSNLIIEETAVIILFAVNISMELKNLDTEEWL